MKKSKKKKVSVFRAIDIASFEDCSFCGFFAEDTRQMHIASDVWIDKNLTICTTCTIALGRYFREHDDYIKSLEENYPVKVARTSPFN